MNCDEAKKVFIAWVYGELEPRRRAGLEQHVASCAPCRGRLAELEKSRAALDLLAEKPVRIEAKAVLQREARRALSSSRRWRRGALATASAAACLLAVMLSGLRLEWHATHVVVGWGDRSREEAGRVPREAEVRDGVAAPATEPQADPWAEIHRQRERLAALDELLRLVVAELESAERRQRRDLGDLRAEFVKLRSQSALRWKLLDEDVRDLGATYLAAYRPTSEPEGKPNPSNKNEQGDRP